MSKLFNWFKKKEERHVFDMFTITKTVHLQDGRKLTVVFSESNSDDAYEDGLSFDSLLKYNTRNGVTMIEHIDGIAYGSILTIETSNIVKETFEKVKINRYYYDTRKIG